jgi:hypothetical protein
VLGAAPTATTDVDENGKLRARSHPCFAALLIAHPSHTRFANIRPYPVPLYLKRQWDRIRCLYI